MDRGNHNIKNNKGFTLIELLVVITIIAVIAGISFSIYQRVIKNAQTAKSISNLRQMGSALATFASDNSSRLPIGWNSTAFNDWTDALSKYVDADTQNDMNNFYISPTSENEITADPGPFVRAITYSAHAYVFPDMPAMSGTMGASNPGFYWGGDDSMLGHYIHKIKNAGEIIFIAEGTQDAGRGNLSSATFTNPASLISGSRGGMSDVALDAYVSESSFDENAAGHISFRNSGGKTACLMGNMSVKSFAKDKVQARNLVFLQ